ncbi:glycosyltransferase family 4 protein [Cohnella massiliensis]|uniref:glycosyltransferase family 4 protein n=1 Tax=Cohnella massiliensis TaxID=1816691 RepID=UPI0009BB1C2F|nr:glycosyltransferase family 4 protein [Cohnella massiliensis]
MLRALVVSHLGRHFRIFGHYDYKVLIEMGIEVHIAANFKEDIDHYEDHKVVKHQIDFVRNPFDVGNIKAYKQLKSLLKEHQFDIIQCQSPTGGAVTRLAARAARRKGTKVVYTAHGFHFYKGAPSKNWIIYYGIEKWLAKFTDTIITINEEDYRLAQAKFGENKARFINGVGIDLKKFRPLSEASKKNLRKKYGFGENDFILSYAAELSDRKNQEMLIYAVHQLKEVLPHLKLLLIGRGNKDTYYKGLVESLGLDNQIKFMGYRNDVLNLLGLADIAVSSSKQEGLPVNILEAMAMGLPLVVTNCRGNRDLIKDGENGYIVEINDIGGLAQKIEFLYSDVQLRNRFRSNSLNLIQQYSVVKIEEEMKTIYSSLNH